MVFSLSDLRYRAPMRSRLTLPWCRTHVRPNRRLGILLLLILGLAAAAPTPTQAESTTRTVSLSAGWSAVVYTGPDVAAATVAADLGADVLTVWDAATQQYDTFYPTLPAALNSLQTLGSGTVVLFQLPAAGTWTMEVLPISPVMTVRAGWNLLPWAPATALPAADVVAPLGSRLHGLYRLTAAGTFDSYLPALPAQFVTLVQVEPLDALWVSVGAGPPIPWAQIAGGDSTEPDSATSTPSEAAQAVVYIESQGISGVGCGSGFVVSPTQVLTAAHVVDDATTITLRFDDGTIKSGQVTGTDASIDLAVVTVAGGVPAALTPLPWAQTDRVSVGADLWVWGFPLCFGGSDGTPTLTRGIISAVQTKADGTVLLQTDAAINQGNSGGPWLTSDGIVVGISSFGLLAPQSPGSGIFAEGLKFATSLTDHQTVIGALLASDAPVVPADPDPATVSDMSFVPATAAFCDLSRPLGPSHNLRASDLGLCVVATYDMAVGTQLDYSWTLDGAVLCDFFGPISEAFIRSELYYYCDPTIAFGSGTYALTIQHNGQTVGFHSQYIARDGVTVSVSDMSFVPATAPFCDLSRPLGPSHNLRASDLGLCLVATYDMAVGTQLDYSWTLDGAVLCDFFGPTSEAVVRGERYYLCNPTIAFGSGLYALTIQHNGQTVGFHSQYIQVNSGRAAPHQFFGDAGSGSGVTVDGEAAADGAAVTAWNEDGVQVAVAIVSGGLWLIQVDPDEAATVSFAVDGASASGSYSVESGSLTAVTLAVTSGGTTPETTVEAASPDTVVVMAAATELLLGHATTVSAAVTLTSGAVGAGITGIWSEGTSVASVPSNVTTTDAAGVASITFVGDEAGVRTVTFTVVKILGGVVVETATKGSVDITVVVVGGGR